MPLGFVILVPLDAPDEESEQRGGHLALAAPAKSSEDFEELRRQAAELEKNGPVHRQPSNRVEIFPADESDKAVIAEDEEPEPQTLANHPRAYYVDKLQPPRKPPVYSKPERDVGSGREGVDRGPDPEKIGPHIGFRVPQG